MSRSVFCCVMCQYHLYIFTFRLQKAWLFSVLLSQRDNFISGHTHLHVYRGSFFNFPNFQLEVEVDLEVTYHCEKLYLQWHANLLYVCSPQMQQVHFNLILANGFWLVD